MDINEIARRAGVSRATVSRYLNDGYVSEEKRALIAQIIAETGYVPSRHARQLRNGKTGLIGVIIPKINSQSVSRMVAGITETLEEGSYQTLLASTSNSPEREVQYLNILSQKNRVDGIILIATAITDAHRAAFDGLKVPLVVLGQHIEGCDCVYHDDYHASRDVTKIVLRSAKTPAFIGAFHADEAAGRRRLEGFLAACAEAGVACDERLQLIGDFTMDSGYFCCEQILDLEPDVDAIVCASDTMAFGALTCLREYGRRVPEDVQVTGIGDSEFSRAVMPSLTTAHLYFKTSGTEAARLLKEALGPRGKSACARELKMGYEVYARSSTL